MLKALHVLLIAGASGLVGLWGRSMLLDIGFIQGFQSEMWACAALAAGYGAAEALFHGCVLILKPTRARSVDITEGLSQLAALILLPSILGFQFSLPAPIPQGLEPLLHFAAFAALHLFFKLMMFFAAVQGDPVSRATSLFWLACAGISVIVLLPSGIRFLSSIQPRLPLYEGEAAPVELDRVRMAARALPENTLLAAMPKCDKGGSFSFLLAPESADTVPADIVYVRIQCHAQSFSTENSRTIPGATTTFLFKMRLTGNKWTPVTLACSDLPSGTAMLTLSWSLKDPGDWLSRLGILKPEPSEQTLLVSEPVVQQGV